MQAATVACRQLGYDLGALHFDVGQNSAFRLRQQIRDQSWTIGCHGEEPNLSKCMRNVVAEDRCNRTNHAVYLVCNRPSMALCQSGYIPFQEKCYRMVQQPLPFLEAQNFCKNDGNAHLVEIKNQLEHVKAIASDMLSAGLRG